MRWGLSESHVGTLGLPFLCGWDQLCGWMGTPPPPRVVTSSSSVPSLHLILLSCNNRNTGSCIVEDGSGFCDGGWVAVHDMTSHFVQCGCDFLRAPVPSKSTQPPLVRAQKLPPASEGGTSQTLPCGSLCSDRLGACL